MSRPNKAKPLILNKEDGVFKEALSLYESKQYKKALKVVDQLLKKHGGYSSALALKGVILENTGEKAESEDYVQRGLQKGPEDHVTTHLAGIFYRQRKDYAKAGKYFQQTIENGSPNKNVNKDLASMLAQTRNYKNIAKARLVILEDQPGYRCNWTACAVGHHLNKDYALAEKTLSRIETMVEGRLRDTDKYEHSELLMYKNTIIGESGDYKAALADIELLEERGEARDTTSLLEYKGKYLMMLGRKKEASVCYRRLLKINPDNASYYYLLEASLGTSNAPVSVRKALYAKLAKFYPKSDPVHFNPLTFLKGDEFTSAASTYIISQLKRGVPSTFVNVKPLYKNSQNRKAILKIVTDFFESEESSVSPLTWCWTAYFLAQHYYYTKDHTSALKYINMAIQHTPTLVEPYIVKARIYKRLNKLAEAAEIMNEGRKLDLQDRFINSKTTKYYLRSNQMEKAIDTIALFTKEDTVKDIHSMQSVWFVLESAEAYWRLYKDATSTVLVEADFEDAEHFHRAVSVLYDQRREYRAIALKRFQAVSKIYDEYYDDQLDFHIYSMRVGAARAYMEMLKWGDELYHQPIYTRVIAGISKLYFDIADELGSSCESADNGVPKKKSKKDKKDDIKRHEEMLKYCTAYDTTSDPDVLGEQYVDKLIKSGKPIEDLVEYYNRGSKDSIEVNYVGFKTNMYLKKYVLCLQNVNKISALSSGTSPLLGTMFLSLKHISENDTQIQAPIKKILDLGLMKAFPELNKIFDSAERVAKVNEKYFAKDNFDTGFAIIEALKFVSARENLQDRLEAIKCSIDPYSSNYLGYY